MMTVVRRIPTLSCVVVTTDEGLPEPLAAMLARQAARLSEQSELVIVANGVQAEAARRLESLVAQVPDVTVHFLADPADPDVATLVGMDRALGDWVVVMTPTEAEIEALPALMAATAGHQVVFAAADGGRGDGLVGLLGRAFFGVFGRLVGVSLEWPTPRLRAYSRSAVRWLTQRLDGSVLMRSTSFRGAFPGCRIDMPALAGNAPKRRLRASIAMAIRQFGRASTVPLRIAIALAIGGIGAGLVALAYTAVIYATHPWVQPGWTTLTGLLSVMMIVFSALFALLTTCVLAIYAAIQPRVRMPVIRELRSERRRLGDALDVTFGHVVLGAPTDAMVDVRPDPVRY